MVIRGSRRAAKMALGSTAIIVAMASTAFACTTYLGRMVVTGKSATGVAQSAEVRGDGNIHGYCAGYSGYSSQTTSIVGLFKITISPLSGCSIGTGTNKLVAGVYKVRVMGDVPDLGSISGVGNFDWLHNNCNVGDVEPTQKIGELNVDSTGYGTGEYPMPHILGNVWVCVTSTVFDPMDGGPLPSPGTGLPSAPSAPELWLNQVI